MVRKRTDELGRGHSRREGGGGARVGEGHGARGGRALAGPEHGAEAEAELGPVWIMASEAELWQGWSTARSSGRAWREGGGGAQAGVEHGAEPMLRPGRSSSRGRAWRGGGPRAGAEHNTEEERRPGRILAWRWDIGVAGRGTRRGCRTQTGLVLGAGMELQQEQSAGDPWRRDWEAREWSVGGVWKRDREDGGRRRRGRRSHGRRGEIGRKKGSSHRQAGPT
ncbi:hypothetical protein PVAP13_2KG321504 [Panicum virgatum]|uniref:Uncharacterized protein n=1 Tax=Panicum virgatum TaxID=38727 RepID=A0A8T0WF14_PANVG|nr:hypothetical protein PVAP13_2KG321504 [Panicum virgatum]